ncbi:MAG: type II secretion system F family protein, partial [Candidatus Aureabacteria bacterium]|nr:type II secretion system F family protein [Candidatus Auribacterota bacterium]
MPEFFYTTLNSNGKEISDVVEASDVSDAADIIRKQGKIIISLKQSGISKNSEGSPFSSLLGCLSFITSSDIVMMFRQFSILIKAGVTLTSSLQILSGQARKTKLKKLLEQVLTSVEEGSTFADALRKHKRIFTPFIVNMIE